MRAGLQVLLQPLVDDLCGLANVLELDAWILRDERIVDRVSGFLGVMGRPPREVALLLGSGVELVEIAVGASRRLLAPRADLMKSRRNVIALSYLPTSGTMV